MSHVAFGTGGPAGGATSAPICTLQITIADHRNEVVGSGRGLVLHLEVDHHGTAPVHPSLELGLASVDATGQGPRPYAEGSRGRRHGSGGGLARDHRTEGKGREAADHILHHRMQLENSNDNNNHHHQQPHP